MPIHMDKNGNVMLVSRRYAYYFEVMFIVALGFPKVIHLLVH